MMMSEQPSLSSSEQQQEVANDDDDVATIDLSRISTGWLQPKRRSQDIEATEILWRREEKDDSENDDVEVEVENDHRSTSSSTLLQQTDTRRKCSSICGVCKQNISRYKCPRCSIPYCSIECYKSHSIPEESNSINNNLVSSSCTEEFYKNRVSSILQLEVRERKDSFTNQILKRRNHSSSILGNGNDDNSNNNGIAEIVDDDVITEELYDLLFALENNNNDYENTESTNIFKQKLSPTLRAMFEFDISKGTILQELGIIKKWHPWWRQELHISNNHIGVENEEEERICFEKPNQTLDERLLDEVRDWTKIKRPNRNAVTSRNNSNGNSNSSLQQQQQQPNLIYNTIDILYGICWTLRLYHGIDNATSIGTTAATTATQKAITTTTTNSTTSISSSSNMALDASETLLDSSTVLGTDARYYTLEQCLMVNTKASTTAASAMIRQSTTTNITTTDIGGSGNGNVNNNFTEWKLLVEDCALICQSKRMIGRALLEGKDLINAAIKQLKLLLESKKKQEEEVNGEEGEEESFRRLRRRQYLSRLRLVKKKIDFYLSYSQSLETNEIEMIRIALIDWAEYWSSSSSSSSSP